jgi:hypothetical protein
MMQDMDLGYAAQIARSDVGCHGVGCHDVGMM